MDIAKKLTQEILALGFEFTLSFDEEAKKYMLELTVNGGRQDFFVHEDLYIVLADAHAYATNSQSGI